MEERELERHGSECGLKKHRRRRRKTSKSSKNSCQAGKGKGGKERGTKISMPVVFALLYSCQRAKSFAGPFFQDVPCSVQLAQDSAGVGISNLIKTNKTVKDF